MQLAQLLVLLQQVRLQQQVQVFEQLEPQQLELPEPVLQQMLHRLDDHRTGAACDMDNAFDPQQILAAQGQ